MKAREYTIRYTVDATVFARDRDSALRKGEVLLNRLNRSVRKLPGFTDTEAYGGTAEEMSA